MRSHSMAALLLGFQARADYFNLKHVSGPCVHPKGGKDIPDDSTDLIYYHECDPSEKKLQLSEEPCSTGGFKLVHWSGKCVNPSGGSATPSDGTALVYHTSCDGDAKLCFQKVPDPETPGYFALQHKHTGKVVNPEGGSSSPKDNTKLVLYTYSQHVETKLLLTESTGCEPTAASGRWVYLRTLAGDQTSTMKVGTKKSHKEQQSETWASETTATVAAGIKLFGAKGQSKISTTEGHSESSKYSDVWSQNTEEEFQISFDQSYEGKALWQWQITIEDSCGGTVPKTEDFAITQGNFEPPKCLPGWKTDKIEYQQCHDAEHTLPGFTHASEKVV